ncbi:uncharacterized protein EI90DRAFT_3123467 [Cantharellus anzutake]|uniref:uncharacterized protein n=1 Tax=Cantharellus anzutake TaxID=1750568 RepID=UPI0019082A84|nr:uncharacterized protein EI90DRAFT_3123467 [Cantharellus anzutake]KAF8331307.1 hypothetical protein EI90DRAFT_3123467 [Cantharellus anzutake]
MPSLHGAFQDSRIEILVPSERLRPISIDTSSSTWWADLHRVPQRTFAFFDEKLYILLVLKLSENADVLYPLLRRLQVALEASYISPFIPSTQTGRKPPPPNILTFGTESRSNTAFFPPATPNPIPATSTPDHPYANADPGINLYTSVWGEKMRGGARDECPEDDFAIAWSKQENTWVAIYEMNVPVAFLQSRVSRPLLCLTTLVTLRDKALSDTPQRRQLTEKIAQAGINVSMPELERSDEIDEGDTIVQSMSEVNLLGSLNQGVTFHSETDPLFLTSARLGPSVCQQAFGIFPFASRDPSDAEATSSHKTTLRKSFRKTLPALEGIKVRMRNCFVPYSPIHGKGKLGEDDDEQDIGTHERTVILSVEIENSEDSGMCFQVENVHVEVSGERSITRFIGWGGKTVEELLPLDLASNDQINLIYAVALASPSSVSGPRPSGRINVSSGMYEDGLDDTNGRQYVSISVIGHPFGHDAGGAHSLRLPTFASKWNCILDLKASQLADPLTWYNKPASPLTAEDALSTPPSPYTGSFPRNVGAFFPSSRQGKGSLTGHRPQGLQPFPAGSSLPNAPKFVPTPPSAVVASFNLNRAATEAAEDHSLTPRLSGFYSKAINALHSPLRTPAFPSLQSPPPPSPLSQFPAGTSSHDGVSVLESRRDTTNLANLPAADSDHTLAIGRDLTHNVLVSVTLLPPEKPSNPKSPKLIYPHDVFSLEILVLNLSDEVRRCEVGYSDSRRLANRGVSKLSAASPLSLMPLDNKIRVGPLLPGGCQSVRMHILALEPGIHLIDSLTLTDVFHRYTVKLRSVVPSPDGWALF